MKNTNKLIDDMINTQQTFINNWTKSIQEFNPLFKQNSFINNSEDLKNQTINYIAELNKNWNSAVFTDSQSEFGKLFLKYVQNVVSSVPFDKNHNQKNKSDVLTILEQLLNLSFPFQEINKYSTTWDVINKYYLLINSISKIMSIINDGLITAYQKSATFYDSSLLSHHTDRLDFNVLFNEWTKTMDNVFISVFSSAEFSKTKADIIHHSLEIKKNLDNQIEHHLKDTPFILRTEMDDLYKTIYEMNKKIKKMEQMLDKVLNPN